MAYKFACQSLSQYRQHVRGCRNYVLSAFWDLPDHVSSHDKAKWLRQWTHHPEVPGLIPFCRRSWVWFPCWHIPWFFFFLFRVTCCAGVNLSCLSLTVTLWVGKTFLLSYISKYLFIKHILQCSSALCLFRKASLHLPIKLCKHLLCHCCWILQTCSCLSLLLCTLSLQWWITSCILSFCSLWTCDTCLQVLNACTGKSKWSHC